MFIENKMAKDVFYLHLRAGYVAELSVAALVLSAVRPFLSAA